MGATWLSCSRRISQNSYDSGMHENYLEYRRGRTHLGPYSVHRCGSEALDIRVIVPDPHRAAISRYKFSEIKRMDINLRALEMMMSLCSAVCLPILVPCTYLEGPTYYGTISGSVKIATYTGSPNKTSCPNSWTSDAHAPCMRPPRGQGYSGGLRTSASTTAYSTTALPSIIQYAGEPPCPPLVTILVRDHSLMISPILVVRRSAHKLRLVPTLF